MNRNILIILLSLLALQLQAVDVENTAGDLSENVSDLSVTSLTVTGTMNAIDFYFIADHLNELEVVDLAGVTILACNSAEPIYCHREFNADELPVGAFGGMALSSVKLPSSLKVIGKAAFAGCESLKTVELPSSLQCIGDYAFAGCSSLESVTVPASVTTVGVGAYMRCRSLTSFVVEPSSSLKVLDAAALMDCPSLKSISLGTQVQTIGERALAATGLENVDLTSNSNLKEIGNWAMALTPAAQISLPDGVENLGDGAFLYNKNLEEINMGNGLLQINDYLLAGTGLRGSLTLSGVNTVGDYALYNVEGISQVELPATLNWMGTRAMAGMTGLTALTSNATTVPELGADVWQGVNQSQVPLTVPAGAKPLYQAAAQWQEFMFEADWLKGDVNNDGEVNIADVNAVVSIILGAVVSDDTMLRADVNEDGEVNIADINMVVKIILTGPIGAPARVDADDRLHMADVAIKPGEHRTLTVTLDHASDYSALQCDIILPAGLTMVGCKTASGHTLESHEVDAATSRTLTYSMDKHAFDDDSQTVLTITVLADASLASESNITLGNIVLANEDNQASHLADCVARVSNTTGINDLTQMGAKVWAEGRTLCIKTSQDGIAQLIAMNGITREVQLNAGVNRFEMEMGFCVVVVNGQSHKIAIK